VILRVFRVRGQVGNDAPVIEFVRESLARVHVDRPGPIRVEAARRVLGGTVEVVVVSTWRSWEEIQAWTGPDVSQPMDPKLPAMFDVRVEHYEALDIDRQGAPS
jgi:heme-degrading monooxygenase HmoA